jgi:hypothetical protein
MADLTLRIIERTLSDGSPVYDVDFNGIVMSAIDRKHAVRLIEKIRAAVVDHTLEIFEDVHGWNDPDATCDLRTSERTR